MALFPFALFFAFDLENFTAFATYEDEIITTAEDLAADTLAAVLALAPYKAAEFTLFSFTYPGRSAFFTLAFFFFMLAFHAIVAIGLFIATLFTPIFAHSIHLIRMIVFCIRKVATTLQYQHIFESADGVGILKILCLMKKAGTAFISCARPFWFGYFIANTITVLNIIWPGSHQFP